MHTRVSVTYSTTWLLLFVRERGSLWGNEQGKRKRYASGWKCVMAPPLSTLLIYLPRRVYFYRIHIDALTTALVYQGISEYQHGVNQSDGCFRLVWVMKMLFPPCSTTPLHHSPPLSKITASTRDAAATFGPPAE